MLDLYDVQPEVPVDHLYTQDLLPLPQNHSQNKPQYEEKHPSFFDHRDFFRLAKSKFLQRHQADKLSEMNIDRDDFFEEVYDEALQKLTKIAEILLHNNVQSIKTDSQSE